MNPLLIDVVLVAALTAALAFSSRLFGPPSVMTGDKGLPYETGMRPFGQASGRMWVSYFRFAVLFVVFDVDLAFLVPWVLMRGSLTFESVAAITVFIGLVSFTLAYLWKRGALECD